MPLPPAEALALLQKADARGRLAHAYLITGPEGCGKRQLATDLCRLIVGTTGPTGPTLEHPDVHTAEPESKSRRIVIEQIREMEQQLQMRSTYGGRKAAVIFDADRLQPQAANAFLKTLEEPPGHSHILLVTALPDQLLETILSRCVEVPVLPTAAVPITARQQALLAVLAAGSQRGMLDLPGVFGLVREFQGLLANARAAASEEGDAEQKKEEKRYKGIVDPKYFEGREDHFKALTESRYIGERSSLLETLEQWWADVLRQQATGGAGSFLEYPGRAMETAALAARFTTGEALRRAGALGRLREQMRNPGIQEQLAIEVAFLGAFGV